MSIISFYVSLFFFVWYNFVKYSGMTLNNMIKGYARNYFVLLLDKSVHRYVVVVHDVVVTIVDVLLL